jgi:hypothetical protein
MRKKVITALAVAILNAVVVADVKGATCEEDSIKSVTDDGEIIVMLSGHVYQVLPGDTIDSMLWLPASDVMICARSIQREGKNMIYYEIINTDDKEKVGAVLLR